MMDWKGYWKVKNKKRRMIEFVRKHYFSKIFCNSIEKYTNGQSSILEAGCGSATYLKILSKKGYDCTGLDNSENALLVAKKNCSNVILGDIFKSSDYFKDNQFDIIFNQGVMEHFNEEETEIIYNEMNKVGKKIVILVPSNLSLFRLLPFYKKIYDDDFIFFSKKELRKRLEKSFNNVKVRYLPKTFFLTLEGYGDKRL